MPGRTTSWYYYTQILGRKEESLSEKINSNHDQTGRIIIFAPCDTLYCSTIFKQLHNIIKYRFVSSTWASSSPQFLARWSYSSHLLAASSRSTVSAHLTAHFACTCPAGSAGTATSRCSLWMGTSPWSSSTEPLPKPTRRRTGHCRGSWQTALETCTEECRRTKLALFYYCTSNWIRNR